MRGGTKDKGLSLIELVVAMAIFALIAVMGLQALSAMVRQQDRLVVLEEENAQISRTTTQLRHDLRAAVPVLFPTDQGTQSAVVSSGTSLSMTVAGQPVLEGGFEMQRVEWAFDPVRNTLSRRVWLGLDPERGTPWVVYLEGVIAVEISLTRARSGGGDGDFGGVSDSLPTAIEIEVLHSAGGLRVFEVLQ